MAGLWRVDEAAAYLGIRPKTLYEWVRLGRVPYRKIGFNVRFDPAELSDWTEGQSRGAMIAAPAPEVPAGPADPATVSVSPTLLELASDACAALRDLEREVGASLSYPQRRQLLDLAQRLEQAVSGAADG